MLMMIMAMIVTRKPILSVIHLNISKPIPILLTENLNIVDKKQAETITEYHVQSRSNIEKKN